MPAKTRKIRLAVLISGSGRTLLNLQKRIEEGSLSARIDVVVSSRGDALGVERSRSLGLRTEIVARSACSLDDFNQRITRAVTGADLVCMAGFLTLWHMPPDWVGRVINIHPALLPEFGGVGMFGTRVHEAVLAAHRSETGCTVHFCDLEYDCGPIILQRRIPVLPEDTARTLAHRVFEEECRAYPEAIQLFAEGRIRLANRRVWIDDRASSLFQ